MVLVVFSRRIVGWAMEACLRTELVLKALDMAVGQWRPLGVIHHPTGLQVHFDCLRQTP